MGSLYLALREVGGNKSVVLTDTSKHQILSPLSGPEWVPVVAPLVNDRYPNVTEVIPVDIIGATAAEKMTNLLNLTALLDQAAAWGRGENVNPVVLDYSAPGSAPQRILSRMIYDWAHESYLPGDFNHRLAAMDRFSMALALECAGEWLQTSWAHPNLVPSSIWDGSPGWTPNTGSLVFTNATTAGYAKGYYSHTVGLRGIQTYTSLGPLNIVSGQTYTLSIRVTDTVGGTATMVLRNNGDSADISTTPTAQAVPAGGSVTNGGTVLTFTVTATSTDASARLRLAFTAATSTSGTTTFCEPMVLLGTYTNAAEPYHPSWTETTQVQGSSTTNPSVHTLTLPFGENLSPCNLRFTIDTGASIPESYIIATPGTPQIIDITTAGAGAWSAVATAANEFAEANSIRRYTATTTNESEFLIGTLGAKISGAWLAFASIKGSAGAAFNAKVRFKTDSTSGITIADTTGIIIPTSATAPNWYSLGMAIIPEPGASAPYIVAQALTGTGSPTFEIDQVVLVPLVRGTMVYWLDAVTSASSLAGVQLEHRLLTSYAPKASTWTFGSTWGTSTNFPIGYRAGGVIRMKDTISVMWLACANSDWRYTSGVTPYSLLPLIERTPSYQVPR